MMPIGTLRLAAILCLLAGHLVLAQDRPAKNPLEGDADAIRIGKGYFRAQCAGCHGVDARGEHGPNLAALLAAGASDALIFDTVKLGRPGTEMPSFARLSDDDVWKTIAYLHTLTSTTPGEIPHGDIQNGERIFWASCGGCHRVNGRGGQLGPNLSRIGSARSPEALTKQIRRGAEDLPPVGYEPVTLITLDGHTIRGVKKNEDVFSIQIMDTNERIQGYLKSELREVRHEKGSLMPHFGINMLSDHDLTDLLTYLGSLRGAGSLR